MDTNYRYDAFVSYAPVDAWWATGYLIDALGVPAHRVLTREGFTPGAALADEVVRAVQESRYTVLILTEAFLTDLWSMFGERIATWSNVAEGAGRVIPVVLDKRAEIPAQLAYLVALDCTEQSRWGDEAAKLRKEINSAAPADKLIECPYPGMVPFGRDDSKWYFGREALVKALVDTLAERPYVALVGTSGSGKSSLINAGLRPRIERDHRFGGVPPRLVIVRPGPSPIAPLAGEIAVASGSDQTAASLTASLSADDGVLRPHLESIPGPNGSIGLLVVDQLEEAFAQCKDDKLRGRFFALLAALLDDPPPDWRLILSMRSDFEDDFDLTSLAERVKHVERIKTLSKEELREAIVEPARSVGVHLQPALVDALIRDAEGQRGPLPLLQRTLVWLWANNLHRRVLTEADYAALGTEDRTGLQQALRLWADTTIETIGAPEDVVRQIFVRLIEFGPPDRKDTRRQQRWGQLVDSVNDKEVERVLNRLIEERLITSDHDPIADVDVVDLAHETLIEAWPTLAKWVERWEPIEAQRRALEATVASWEASGRDRSFTQTGRQLRETEAWAREHPSELGDAAMAFLDASRARDRRDRIQRWSVVGLVVLAGAIFVGATAYYGPRVLAQANTGSALVEFPAGQAMLAFGSADGADRPVDLGAFSLEVSEVTNGQWHTCVTLGPCTPSEDPAQTDDPERAEYPVTWVVAEQAQSYCAWIGRRLPNVYEWERAARGTEARAWPWGDEPPREAGIPGLGDMAAVTDGTATRSPEGIYHLVGNVDEWATYEENGLPLFAHAGGSFQQFVPTTEVVKAVSIDQGPASGFRCAKGGA